MMPTFPRSSLLFRTAGFPYWSGRAPRPARDELARGAKDKEHAMAATQSAIAVIGRKADHGPRFHLFR